MTQYDIIGKAACQLAERNWRRAPQAAPAQAAWDKRKPPTTGKREEARRAAQAGRRA